MRIILNLNSKDQQLLDINYNYYISAFIYSCLKEINEDMANKLHNEGFRCNYKNYKMFTFSNLFFENYKIEKERIIFSGNVKLSISSPFSEFIEYLVKSILFKEEIKLGSAKLKVDGISIPPIPEFKERMRFKTISPITMSTALLKEDGRLLKRDLYIEDERFIENIRRNVLAKYEIIHKKLPDDIRFDINFGKNTKGKLIKYKNGINIKGYLTDCEIIGNPELIEIAYECGLGDRNSLGFGMIECLEKY
ncbi:CRISPR-associated endoribonuclease Cas6 [Caloramator proteoclasticus]|uniref:CRISPR-associated endoribonuclease n=1 Tax=Caloramator proteoclasticus DSM 10124 TaxID=1121262 RepID=A0A1M4ZNW5_9CLOT|nr:CRISPR-associated endoribonuclease Cas6 [Caloramator proteoclasticus]SHF19681.1 CRISPR-associated endoribonuclease Cas6 [Caloramator proteoclasticus DSM 10124]